MENLLRKRLLVVQHVAVEGPGLVLPMALARNWEVEILRMDRCDPLPSSSQGWDGLLVLGGPMNVYEEEACPYLRPLGGLMAEALAVGTPIAGICLGAQLLAKVLGAGVRKNHRPEVGWYDLQLTEAGRLDPVFRGLLHNFTVFQWHGDTFDLPVDATLLATGQVCRHQAFRWRERAYGFQFHFEVTPEMVDQWVENGHAEIEGCHGPGGVELLRRQGGAFLPTLQQTGEIIIANLFKLFA